MSKLAKYYRTPGFRQMLSTKGRFINAEMINEEIEIKPMTALDEMMLRNPDALLNGEAIKSLIESCVPSIDDPMNVSMPDLDVIILAIKLASLGDDLDLPVVCPKCDNHFTATASIKEILSNMKVIKDEDIVVRIDDSTIVNIKPYTLKDKINSDKVAFEETKALHYLLDTDISDDEKSKLLFNSFKSIVTKNYDLLSECVISIVCDGEIITDKQEIIDFMENGERSIINMIKDKIVFINNEFGIPSKKEIICSEDDCQHIWETDIIYDPTNFFV